MFTPNKFILGIGWVVNKEQLFIKLPNKGKKGLQRDLFHQHKCCCEVYYPSKHWGC